MPDETPRRHVCTECGKPHGPRRNRGNLPPPLAISQRQDRMLKLAESIPRTYRWLHSDAFRRPKHAGLAGRGGKGKRTPSDLADTVASTDHFRSHLRDAAVGYILATELLAAADKSLGRAQVMLEPPAIIEPAEIAFVPHPATRRELAVAKAARDRRNTRAVKSGDRGETTG